MSRKLSIVFAAFLVLSLVSTGLAANGQPLTLGSSTNSATALTTLTSSATSGALKLISSTAGTALVAQNTGTGPAISASSKGTSGAITAQNTGGGPAGSFTVLSGKSPFTVSSGAGKVPNLDADKLDGLHSSSLQLKLKSGCAAGSYIQSVAADGTVTCGNKAANASHADSADQATNASTLNGKPDSAFLGANAQAADSAKLGGQPPSSYQLKLKTSDCTQGSYIQAIAQDGTVTCATDKNSGGTLTGVTAGNGVSVDNTDASSPKVGIAAQGVDTAQIKDNAVTTGKFASDAKAPDAIHADSATTAGDASTLGGQAPSAYQSRVTGSCTAGSYITAVNANGTVTCGSKVADSSHADSATNANNANYLGGKSATDFMQGRGQVYSGRLAIGAGNPYSMLFLRTATPDLQLSYFCPSDLTQNGWLRLDNTSATDTLNVFADGGATNPTYYSLGPGGNIQVPAAATGEHYSLQVQGSTMANIEVYSVHRTSDSVCHVQGIAWASR